MSTNHQPPKGPARQRARGVAQTAWAIGIAAFALPAQIPSLTADQVHHVFNRATFGLPFHHAQAFAGPVGNVTSWLTSQLNPSSIAENPDLDTALQQLHIPTAAVPNPTPATLTELRQSQVARAMLSRRELQAVMAYFWENHFNTTHSAVSFRLGRDSNAPLTPSGVPLVSGTPATLRNQVAVQLELATNDIYRNQAIGTFRDLLRETTLSPAMMVYLDLNISVNVAGNGPNENYAREFLELYSMGPNSEATGQPNYTNQDVATLARAFAGWKVTNQPTNNLVSSFDPNRYTVPATGGYPMFAGTPHGQTFQQTFAGSIPVSPLPAIVDAVAQADATREFICRKLMRYFLSDEAGNPGVHDFLLQQMMSDTVWGAEGDLQAVLGVLLGSDEFLDGRYAFQRARTPFEKGVWWQRVWDASLISTLTFAIDAAKTINVNSAVIEIGESLFEFPSPDGIPLESDEQPGSSVAIDTWRYGARLFVDIGAWPNFYANHPTVILPFLTQSNDPTVVAPLFLTRLYGTNWTLSDRTAVEFVLATDLNGIQAALIAPGTDAHLKWLTIGAVATGSLLQASLK